MKSVKNWKELFNNDKKDSTKTKNDFVIIQDIINSNNNGIYIREKIPQSIIKKSMKESYKK